MRNPLRLAALAVALSAFAGFTGFAAPLAAQEAPVKAEAAPEAAAEPQAEAEAEAKEEPVEAAAADAPKDEAAAEKLALAERYLTMPAIQKMNDDIYGGSVIDAMMAAQGDSLPKEAQEKLGTILREEFAKMRPGLEKSMIEAASEIFTVEELEAMIAFYDTPEGASVAAKTAPFMQKTMVIAEPLVEEFQSALVQRLMTEMK